MVIGADIIFIIGTAVIAGSVRQAEDHMWFRLDTAASDLDATMAPLGLVFFMMLLPRRQAGTSAAFSPDSRLYSKDFKLAVLHRCAGILPASCGRIS